MTECKPALMSVGEVARELDLSERSVYRLRDSGQMPDSVRLGGLVKWVRATIDAWIAGGCRPVRV